MVTGLSVAVQAQPADESRYKSLPPRGIDIGESRSESLVNQIEAIETSIDETARDSDAAGRWRPDVEVFTRAVRLALDQHLFYRERDVDSAERLLRAAEQRLQAVRDGSRGLALLKAGTETSGEPMLAVGGFRSRIDNSVQPFGLVLPAGFDPHRESPYRLDVWLHGRGDRKTEIPFIVERMTRLGQYAPRDTVVLHPFGRHCNAFKFAGERDVYEAIAHVRKLVRVDPKRIAIRGFSMGGAGCWHLTVHDPTQWFASNPGAGFVDTLVYQGWGDDPPFALDPVQKKLLRWYDVLPWVENLQNTRVAAYSGEVDKQKQAADRVRSAAIEAGVIRPGEDNPRWRYVIGPEMGHKIDPDSAETINDQFAKWADEVSDQPRREIDFVTYTLRYARAGWLTVTGLEEHWRAGRVNARLEADATISIQTKGITRLTFDFSDSGWSGNGGRTTVRIDGETLSIEDEDDRRGLQCRLVRDRAWRRIEPLEDTATTLRKRPGLQGPIDDALTRPFLFVAPSRPARHGAVERWIDREFEFAKRRWREIMRGDVRVVRDTELTDARIADHNLICFGDFESNRYLAKVRDRLPFRWGAQSLSLGDRSFRSESHAAVFCFPNPEASGRYVVVNSGLTFREFSNVSNSRQIAMLPDWAVIDVTRSGEEIFPGGVVAKGFFDESWQAQ
jgi:hypothetical protein